MPSAKKAVVKKTNGHRRNGVIPQEQIALLEKEYNQLKTEKARERFLDQLTFEERYYFWLATWDAEGTRKRLEMLGLL